MIRTDAPLPLLSPSSQPYLILHQQYQGITILKIYKTMVAAIIIGMIILIMIKKITLKVTRRDHKRGFRLLLLS
jgi:hypothetical protein